MHRTKILFICGSLNQTTMMHKIADQLPEYDAYFTPYYALGFLGWFAKTGLLDFTILAGQAKQRTLDYLNEHNLKLDAEGKKHNYEMVFTCSDLIMPKNILNKKIILVQEGMTDPENFAYHLVKNLRLPRWLASTSTTGLSKTYDYFCVASEGYREFFISKGIPDEKIIVTGIPNFDNCRQYLENDFPHKNFVLVATSDMRETYKYENRKKFIRRAVKIADGKKLIFKLHPNEKIERATKEIKKFAPDALVYHSLSIDPLIANCDTLITRYSSVVYIGLALGKKVYSDFDVDHLERLVPIQNGGTSAKVIADFARALLKEMPAKNFYEIKKNFNFKPGFIKRLKTRKKLAG